MEKQQVFTVVRRVVTALVLVFALVMMVFTLVSVTTVDRNDRAIFGMHVYVVTSDSMSPDYFDAGDIIFSKKVKDVSTVQEGDVISFQSLMNDDSYGKVVTHRVREVRTDKEGKPVGFITYGTHTGKNDSAVVTPSFVLGKYVGKLPKLGTFFQYLKSPVGYVIFILVPFLLLIGTQGYNCILIFKKYKKEQLALLNKEKEAVEKDRQKAQEMMTEIEALKAQLAAAQKENLQKEAGDTAENPKEETEKTDGTDE